MHPNCSPHDGERARRASWAFSTRRVPPETVRQLLPLVGAPQAGDLILAKVDSLGQHPGLQLPCGRRKQLFPGDEIVVAYGNRYASNQFESVVPETLGPCHLAAGGGIASRVLSWHVKMTKGPTQITPIALLGTADARRVNLADYAIERLPFIRTAPPCAITVVGTGMDSGKTQSCAFLVRGLIGAGLNVGYAKITGTGAGGDFWMLTDAGARPVIDFTDAGMATTYLASPEQVEQVLLTLVGHLAHSGVDAMVLEIADGVLQRETSALLRSPVFANLVGGIIMASQDSMGAAAGVQWLRRHADPPVLALSGIISAAPLQAREAVAELALPVYDRQGLATPANAMRILAAAQRHAEQARQRRRKPPKGQHHERYNAMEASAGLTGSAARAFAAAGPQERPES